MTPARFVWGTAMELPKATPGGPSGVAGMVKAPEFGTGKELAELEGKSTF